MACRECVNCGYMGNVLKCPDCGSTNLTWDEVSFNESFEDWRAGEEEQEDSVSSVVDLTEKNSPEGVNDLRG